VKSFINHLSKTLSKGLSLVALFGLMSLSYKVEGQNILASQSTTFTATGSSGGVNLVNTPVGYHKIYWRTQGTVTTCTVALDSSSDGVAWNAGGVITGQTCTSNGTTVYTNSVVNFVRISVTTLTGGGSLIATYVGASDPLAVQLSQVLSDTPSAVQPTIYTAGSLASSTQTQHGESFVAQKDIKHDPMGMASVHGRTIVGIPSQIFYDPMDQSTINTNLEITSTTGAQTITQTNKELTLNAGAITTISTASQISSVKQINFLAHFPAHIHWIARPTTCPAGGSAEMGIGNASGLTAPTDGTFFRCVNGAWTGVLNFNGTETTCANSFTVDGVDQSPVANQYNTLEIYWDHRQVTFWSNKKAICQIPVPGANPAGMTVSHLPFFARVVNSGTPATAVQLLLSEITIAQQDINWGKSWHDIVVSSMERGAWQNPTSTWNQLENWTNSTAASSATLSNTAAGYTTLGGLFQFAAPAGAVTDYALFGYQVPTGFQLYVTRVSISCMNTGAAVGGVPTIMQWGLAVNSNNVSLATTEAPPTSWQPRRLAIGQNSLLAAAAIGAPCTPVTQDFDPPLVVDSGRFFHIIVNVPVGAATVSQVITGTAMVNGYFE
jgi:hypothetical protein